MPWFKVDDTFPHHAKVLAAGNAAVGLWVRAGAWSMQQLTDGFIPSHVAATLGSKTEANRLITVGLWLEVDGGYQFHQWTDVQRTREQVKADRDAATQRQKRAREASKSHRESRRDTAVSHGPPDQTRPDQTNTDAYASDPAAPAAVPERFDQFWNTYDKKDGRKPCIAAYRTALKKSGVTEDLLIAAAASYVESVRLEGKHPQFTKNPLTWLRGEHWTDERVARAAPQTRVQEHLALVRQLGDQDQALPQIGERR